MTTQDNSHDPEDGCIPCISSDRFDIYHHDICRSDRNGGLCRSVYHAWFHSDDIPHPVCVVTINECFSNFVEWIYVDEHFRRNGIATEVLHAIEQEIGTLTMEGATEAGVAFCQAYEDKFPSEVE